MAQARITNSEAMAIAKAECEGHRWPWIEPVTVRVNVTLPPGECGWRHWTVKTNAKAHGATAHAFFDVSFDGRHVLSHWIGQPGPRDPAWREAGDSLTDAACLSLSPGTLPMTSPGPIRVTLLVLYTPQLEECRNFYARLGLAFTTEQHGHGPEHFAAVLADGTVFELYPSTPGRQTNTLRLGLAIEGNAASPPLDKGHHQVTDPDGRTVEVLAS